MPTGSGGPNEMRGWGENPRETLTGRPARRNERCQVLMRSRWEMNLIGPSFEYAIRYMPPGLSHLRFKVES